MRTNRLIILIAVIFSVLVNMPRITSFLGIGSDVFNSLVTVSLGDIIFRIVIFFSYSFIILTLNIKWIPKIKESKRIIIQVISNPLVFIIWTLSFRIINNIFYGNDDYIINDRAMNFGFLFVLLMLLIISKAIKSNIQSKADAIENEKLKHQNLQNELAALKNQLNPHFLFNTLNSLSLLVREDQKAAGKFINKLSFLYRYLLQSKDQDLVSLKEELKFLESYIHLILVRYQENFIVDIKIDEKLHQTKIPTLALQLLMENAIKHNEISHKKPLNIDVYNQENYIVVKNKLQPRNGFPETTNTGLANLNARFKIWLNKEIKILNDGEYFTVKLPIQ